VIYIAFASFIEFCFCSWLVLRSSCHTVFKVVALMLFFSTFLRSLISYSIRFSSATSSQLDFMQSIYPVFLVQVFVSILVSFAIVGFIDSISRSIFSILLSIAYPLKSLFPFRISPFSALFLAACSLLVLVYFGPAGLLWFTDPRDAYIIGRKGVGVAWVAFCFSNHAFAFCSLYDSSPKRKSLLRFLAVGAISLPLSVISGSKGQILSIVILILLLYIAPLIKLDIKAYFFKALSLRFNILLFSCLLVIPFAFLAIFAFSRINLLDYTAELAPYFAHLNITIDQLSSGEPIIKGIAYPGQIALTSIVNVVPRFLRPADLDFGTNLLHRVLDSNSLDQGNTPFLDPFLIYVNDFGLYGSIIPIFSATVFNAAWISIFFSQDCRTATPRLNYLLPLTYVCTWYPLLPRAFGVVVTLFLF